MSSGIVAPPSGRIDVSVGDVTRIGEGLSSHFVYAILTRTDMIDHFGREELIVRRRYRDFRWLHCQFGVHFKGTVLPPVPEKGTVLNKFQSQDKFVEERRQALAVWLQRVCAHPTLRHSPDLLQFLSQSDDEWAMTMARSNVEVSTASLVASTINMFRGLNHRAANLVQGRSDDEAEDPDYLKFRDFISILEGHTGEMHKQALRSIRKVEKHAEATRAFGLAARGLAQYEPPQLAAPLDVCARVCGEVAGALERNAAVTGAELEAPMKEAVRGLREVRATMEARSRALSATSRAQADLDTRRTKLNRLQSTPGVTPDKVRYGDDTETIRRRYSDTGGSTWGRGAGAGCAGPVDGRWRGEVRATDEDDGIAELWTVSCRLRWRSGSWSCRSRIWSTQDGSMG